MARVSLDEIKAEAKRLADEFAGHKIVYSVLASEDADRMGDPIVFVRIVLKTHAPKKRDLQFGNRITSGLAAFLKEKGDPTLPILSFLRQDELKAVTSPDD
jgi:hypothetical protein